MTSLRAIDPPGCGCTDCLPEETGDSVPLERATGEQIAALLNGELMDHTGVELTVTTTVAWEHLTWTISSYRHPAA